MRSHFTFAALLAAAAAAPISSSTSETSATTTSISDTWYTLTPTGTLPANASAITSIAGSYALSLRTIDASVSSAFTLQKRDVVSQIGDGQIQAGTATEAAASTTASVVNQISDGQIQAQSTVAATTADVINQISDGQIQQQSTTAAAETTADVVNQIGDGQIQQQTTTAAAETTADVVNQIGDGQIQQQTTAAAESTASVVNQISDGQIQQQTTAAAETTAAVVSQISDGQIQATTVDAASQISDGQVQASTSTSSASSDDSDSEFGTTCVTSDAVTIVLTDGELRDAKGRVGAIVANRQFQFDGPPPQAGTIYAAGWSFVPASYAGLGEDDSDTTVSGYKLALGDQTTFYKCLSGDFYNLYDASIGGQCSAVEIFVLKAEEC